MSNPIDDETYGGPATTGADEVRNGNPGRPQSDFEFDDAEPAADPSEFPADGDVVPGTTAPTDR